jgi:hypothetical protein
LEYIEKMLVLHRFYVYLCHRKQVAMATIGGGSAKAKRACLCIRLARWLQCQSEDKTSAQSKSTERQKAGFGHPM